jgi:FKBP-type peptidyl-prolyl cis-trans isomerase FkpA
MKNLKMIRLAGAAVLIAALIAGCKSGNHFPGYEKSPSGLYSKFYVSNQGARKPKIGEIATISVRYYTAKDSLIMDSHSIKESDNGFITQAILKSTFQGGLEEALMSMSEGDSIYLKMFRVKEVPKFIEKGSLLTFYIKMKKVQTQQELMNEMNTKETNSRNDFLKQNNITVDPTASGLYFIEKEKGSGPDVQAGQTALVRYSGSFVNGRVFDSTESQPGQKPIEIVVGKGQVIKGWDEALLRMKKGGKAMLVIPSSIAYGAQGRGPIPMFSTLVFTLEVTDIKANK